MASLPRRNVPPPMSTTASASNNAVMSVTSPAFYLATNNRSKSWGSLAGSLVVKSFIVTVRQLLWVARPSLKPIVVRRRASNNGVLREVMKGWYVPSQPDEKEGDSTA